MKNKYFLFYWKLLLLGIISSCVVDHSNYEFREVNDVEISGIELKYNAVMLDSLKIYPIITRTLDATEDNLEYVWTIYNIQTFNFADTLAQTRNLEIIVNTIPGDYQVSYRVKDKQTGVSYRYEFDVSIVSELQRGFLALSELNGKADVTFINIFGTVYESIYNTINEEDLGVNPISIRYTSQSPLDYVAILCNDSRGGVYLSSNSFKKLFDYKDFFYESPSTIMPQAMEVQCDYGWQDYQSKGYNSFIINDNKLYFRVQNSTVKIDGVNTTVESKFYSAYPGDYELSPVSFQARGYEAFYDTKYKRLLYIPNYAQPNLWVTAAKPAAVFDPANVGMDLIWGKTNKTSNRREYMCNSIFKDDQNNYFYLQFDIGTKSSIVPKKKVAIPSQFKIREAKTFTGNYQDGTFIYFAVNSKVYVYDCIMNQEREVFDFGPGKNVDNIRWHDEVILSRKMHICTTTTSQSGKNGSIYEMNVQLDGTLSISNSYENVCGKVVSTDWKN